MPEIELGSTSDHPDWITAKYDQGMRNGKPYRIVTLTKRVESESGQTEMHKIEISPSEAMHLSVLLGGILNRVKKMP